MGMFATRTTLSFGVLVALMSGCAHTTPSAETATTTPPEVADTDAVAEAPRIVVEEHPEDWVTTPELDDATLAALPAAPWSEAPLELIHAPAPLLRAWAEAENRGWCAPLAPAAAESAHARTVPLDGGFGVVFDAPGQPGVTDDGEVCATCGTGSFGMAGTMMTPAELAEDTGTLDPSYADGSYASVVEDGGVASATFTVAGQDCVYQVWSFQGEAHLRALLEGMRRVDVSAGAEAVLAGL